MSTQNEDSTANKPTSLGKRIMNAIWALLALVIFGWLFIWLPICYVGRLFTDDPRPVPLTITKTSKAVCEDMLNPAKKALVEYDYSNCMFCFIEVNGERHTAGTIEQIMRVSPVEWIDARKEGEWLFSVPSCTTGRLWHKKEHPHISITYPNLPYDYLITIHVDALASSNGRLWPRSFKEAAWEKAEDQGIIMAGSITVRESATGDVVETIDIPRLRGPHPWHTRRKRHEEIFNHDCKYLYETLKECFVLAHEQELAR